jgi:serine/threonine protein kinase
MGTAQSHPSDVPTTATADTVDERSIFFAALDIDAPADRAAYLDRACAHDAALRNRVAGLLAADAGAGDFLRTPAIEDLCPGAYARPPEEGPGARIGPYKLLEKIGEGGMGVVYMAEQERPVRRKVALKIVKPGMDSAQVVGRFEAERQALAMMEHRNIAKVLDAGATAAGRPYFVMELVHGVPITRYCDDNRLTLHARLALFVQVCRAVQHAHQKGIIHRDIKPSNVLVTLYDGDPVPKVIDFGVAKAVEQQLTERTLFTRYGVLVGTVEYMAPEQAEMNALGVDTRSDVYSLGVLLYELLTGTTPLERGRLRDAAFLELVRLVRDEEPPAPSTRLSSSGDQIATIAASRQVESHRLTRLVRGELDWIVMRCLEKDRARRYETADALAEDVRRYLADEPVAAGPPTAGYRLRKFARRNVGLLIATSAVAAALVLGAGLATWGLVSARHERREAIKSRDAADHQRTLAESSAKRAIDGEKKVQQYYQTARTQFANAEAVNNFLVNMFAANSLGKARPDTTVRELLDRAAKSLEQEQAQATRNEKSQAAIHNALGLAYTGLGMYDVALPHLNVALDVRRRVHGADHPDVALTLSGLAYWANEQGQHEKAEGHLRDALAIRRKKLGPDHPTVATTLSSLAFTLSQLKKPEAAAVSAEALALRHKLYGAASAEVAAALSHRGLALKMQGKLDEAEQAIRESVAMYRRFTGENSLNVARAVNNLGRVLAQRDDLPGAIAAYREALDISRRYHGDVHPEVADGMITLAHALAKVGDHAAAVRLKRDRLTVLLAIVNEKLARRPDDPRLLAERADLYGRQGEFAHAAADLGRAAELKPDEPYHAFDHGLALLYLGDLDAHRRVARRMLDQFETSPAPQPAELAAKQHLMAPGLDAEDLFRCLRIADRTTGTPAEPWLASWYRLTKAIALYRANLYQPAIDAFDDARRSQKAPLHVRQHVTALCFTAMAHHRLNRPDEAKADLAEAGRIINAEFLGLHTGDYWKWQEAIQLVIHHREARALIDGARAAAPPPPP